MESVDESVIDDELLFFTEIAPKFASKTQLAAADLQDHSSALERLSERGYLKPSAGWPGCYVPSNSDPLVLNAQCPYKGPVVDAVTAAKALRKQLLALHSAFISEAGVDYQAMRASREFAAYRLEALQLQSVDLYDLKGSEEAMPFFLNIYNCIIIHATLAVEMPSTALGRSRFFGRISYSFKGMQLSANDVEHGILRGNRPAPGTFFSSHHWKATDKRASLAMDPVDCRIHFALNCGARSCPPIRVFSTANLERALQLSAEGFLRDSVQWDAARNVVTVSKILSWYSGDFPKDLVPWLCTFLDDDHPMRTQHNAKTKVAYASYDWTVNDSKNPGSSSNSPKSRSRSNSPKTRSRAGSRASGRARSGSQSKQKSGL